MKILPKRQQLASVLAICNLIGTVHFPARIISGSILATDNIFIDKTSNYTGSPFINGVSNHNAQVINLNNIFFLQKRVVCET